MSEAFYLGKAARIPNTVEKIEQARYKDMGIMAGAFAEMNLPLLQNQYLKFIQIETIRGTSIVHFYFEILQQIFSLNIYHWTLRIFVF